MDNRKTLEKLKEMKVGVLMGGMSNEREVSLKSGSATVLALERQGINSVGIDIGRDMHTQLADEGVDVAYIALHGRYGEDGCVQGALELLNIPYTGSKVASSAIAMSKTLTKLILKALEIDTPDYQAFEKRKFFSGDPGISMSAPVVVKPANGGSSINVTICMADDQIAPAIEAAFENDDEVLVERFIDGKLLTIGIVGETLLPAIEIEVKSGFYDYANKYTPGATLYHVPARLDKAVIEEAGKIALKVHRALRCKGVSRSELIIDESKKSWFIELNTIPGMTETSLLPKAASAMGISFDELVLTILKEAIENV